MTFLLLFSFVYAVDSAAQRREIMSFSEWREHYENVWDQLPSKGKSLESRESAFNENIEKMKQQNALHDTGQSGFRFGVNRFSDLTAEEFADKVGLGLNTAETPAPQKEVSNELTDTKSIDWRTRGAVTPVKNQGQCGSCYTFSTTGAIESAVAIATGKLVSLSEMQIKECSAQNYACIDGVIWKAYDYVIVNGGLSLESDYPYQSQEYLSETDIKDQCNASLESEQVATISSYAFVPVNNTDQMLAAVAKQPVSVEIMADKAIFQHYSSGVLDSSDCYNTTDHAVLVVGFTAEDDENYPNAWIVKNSWGLNWGVDGYVYISRDTQYCGAGVQGILTQPLYPIGGKLVNPDDGKVGEGGACRDWPFPPTLVGAGAPPNCTVALAEVPGACENPALSPIMKMLCAKSCNECDADDQDQYIVTPTPTSVVTYDNTGVGMCDTAGGEDLSEDMSNYQFYLKMDEDECRDSCTKMSNCGGYTSNSANNCLLWMVSPPLKGNNEAWVGDSYCMSKVVENETPGAMPAPTPESDDSERDEEEETPAPVVPVTVCNAPRKRGCDKMEGCEWRDGECAAAVVCEGDRKTCNAIKGCRYNSAEKQCEVYTPPATCSGITRSKDCRKRAGCTWTGASKKGLCINSSDVKPECAKKGKNPKKCKAIEGCVWMKKAKSCGVEQ